MTAAGTPGVVSGLVLGYVVLLPIGWSPFPASVQWSDVLFVPLFAWWIATRGRAGWSLHPLDGLVAVYLLGSLPSLAATTDVRQSLLQYAKEIYLALVYLVFATTRPLVLRRIAETFGVVTAAIAAVGLGAVIVHAVTGVRVYRLGLSTPIPYFGETFRLYGPFHSAEYLADYFTFVFPLILGLAAHGASVRARVLWLVGVAATAVAAAATLAHGLGGLLAAALAYGWRAFGERRRVIRAVAMVLVVGVLLAFNVVLLVAVRKIVYERGVDRTVTPPAFEHGFQSADGAPTLSVRVAYNLMSYGLLKKIALETFLSHPSIGIGLGRFHEATERAYRQGEIHAVYRLVDPHSTLLGRLAETGIIGGASVLLLWAGVVWLGVEWLRRPGPNRWLDRAIFAGIVGLLVNSLNADVMHFRFLWVGLGLLRGAEGEAWLMGKRVDHAARA
jgi:hypothetical protein